MDLVLAHSSLTLPMFSERICRYRDRSRGGFLLRYHTCEFHGEVVKAQPGSRLRVRQVINQILSMENVRLQSAIVSYLATNHATLICRHPFCLDVSKQRSLIPLKQSSQLQFKLGTIDQSMHHSTACCRSHHRPFQSGQSQYALCS